MFSKPTGVGPHQNPARREAMAPSAMFRASWRNVCPGPGLKAVRGTECGIVYKATGASATHHMSFFHSSTEGPETTRKLMVELTANPVILVTLFSPLFLAKLWQLFAKIANKREVDTTCAFTHCVSKSSEACPQCQIHGIYHIFPKVWKILE